MKLLNQEVLRIVLPDAKRRLIYMAFEMSNTGKFV
jgi:hypothetical protein